jgi:ribose-phosphate pyrophosphokinase
LPTQEAIWLHLAWFIFDDMIATGGLWQWRFLPPLAGGARRVFLAAVHLVLTGSAILKLYRSGVEAVLATDTLDKGVSTVSVAPLIAKALRG